MRERELDRLQAQCVFEHSAAQLRMEMRIRTECDAITYGKNDTPLYFSADVVIHRKSHNFDNPSVPA